MNNLQQNILNKIKNGELDMKPKWHFVLKAGLLLSGVVVATLLVVYLLSLAFFFMHQSGIIFAPEFGMRGIGLFLVSSPWLLIGMSIVFLTLLYFLVTQYSFSYHRPLLYSMIGVVVIALIGSGFVQQTTMHQRMGEFVGRHEVPVFSPLYREALNQRPEGVVVGVITEVNDNGFVIDSERDGTVGVSVTNDTRMKPGTKLIVGEVVMVFGDRQKDTIDAFGVRLPKSGEGEFFRKPSSQEGQLMRPMMNGSKQMPVGSINKN